MNLSYDRLSLMRCLIYYLVCLNMVGILGYRGLCYLDKNICAVYYKYDPNGKQERILEK